MKQSTDLLNTTQEGLEHVHALLKEGKFEDHSTVSDIVLAFQL